MRAQNNLYLIFGDRVLNIVDFFFAGFGNSESAADYLFDRAIGIHAERTAHARNENRRVKYFSFVSDAFRRLL